jgi:hypothetical protein
MNREDIIKMAREAGFSVAWPETVPNFERFAALVAAAEREACAVLVERGMGDWLLGKKVANAIRARGQQ